MKLSLKMKKTQKKKINPPKLDLITKEMKNYILMKNKVRTSYIQINKNIEEIFEKKIDIQMLIVFIKNIKNEK